MFTVAPRRSMGARVGITILTRTTKPSLAWLTLVHTGTGAYRYSDVNAINALGQVIGGSGAPLRQHRCGGFFGLVLRSGNEPDIAAGVFGTIGRLRANQSRNPHRHRRCAGRLRGLFRLDGFGDAGVFLEPLQWLCRSGLAGERRAKRGWMECAVQRGGCARGGCHGWRGIANGSERWADGIYVGSAGARRSRSAVDHGRRTPLETAKGVSSEKTVLTTRSFPSDVAARRRTKIRLLQNIFVVCKTPPRGFRSAALRSGFTFRVAPPGLLEALGLSRNAH